MSLRQLPNDRINKILHNLQLVLLIKPNYLLNNVLHRIDEILKSHLVLIGPRSHDLDENQVVILFRHLFAGHPCEIGQLCKLG